MNIGKIIVGSTFAVFFVLLCIAGMVSYNTYKSYQETGKIYEDQIDSTIQSANSTLRSVNSVVYNIGNVPAEYRSDYDNIIGSAVQGKYGDQGSERVLGWIKEKNPNIDELTSNNIIENVDRAKVEYRDSEVRLLSLSRSYDSLLNSSWSGLWLNYAGYPNIDYNRYESTIDGRN